MAPNVLFENLLKRERSALKPRIEPTEPAQDVLTSLFISVDMKHWFKGFINFCNQYQKKEFEALIFFQGWTSKQLQYALDFFARPESIKFINTIFFYKVYPQQLFLGSIHPEKLVSLQLRLGLIHHYIELMQQQLFRTALQRGLNPAVDYLVHAGELPHGVSMKVCDEAREHIQKALGCIKIATTKDYDAANSVRAHSLLAAYKFSFNPSRLIDVVMLLRQVIERNDHAIFCHEMIAVYRQLTTTECLDLYGYFSNGDTQHLLQTLTRVIHEPHLLDWLPPLKVSEQNAAEDIFDSLRQVLEALRTELKNRFIITEPYKDEAIEIKPYTRRAIIRALTIYYRR